MHFEQRMKDLGRVKKGDTRKLYFEFTNTGDQPLEIDFISACECSTIDHPVLPIPPGESGKIDIIFDSTNEDAEKIVDITIVLKHFDPKYGTPVIEEIQYKAFVYE